RVSGVALGDDGAVTHDAVVEAHGRAARLADIDVDIEQVFVVGGAAIAAVGFDDGQGHAPGGEVVLRAAEAAQEGRARRLEEAHVVAVVHDAHLVRVAEDDPELMNHGLSPVTGCGSPWPAPPLTAWRRCVRAPGGRCLPAPRG